MPFIIDKDGTLISEGKALVGAAELINKLNSENIPYLIMTNNIRNPKTQIERLWKAGICVKENSLINPITAINHYIKDQGHRRARIIGTDDAIDQIACESVENGNDITILVDFEHGNFGYSYLQNALDDIENGIKLITATYSSYYINNGRKTIDTGAFAKLIESISGKKIINIGKPSLEYFEIARRMLNVTKDEITIIGDDWETDISGANMWGVKSIFVKSGKYENGDEKKITTTRLINSLIDINI